tara:strand:+ start:1741 stop:2994 length:1254 start_codon:yes stop_codon:yes gene_type:complete
MGKFKLNAPYKLDPIPRYEVPFQPDNTEDDSGLVAKANKNGTMIVNKNIPIDDPVRKEAESHEDHHIKDMMDGKLDYDDEKVYETISTGKVKEHSRDDFKESDKNLAWEKDAYKAGESLEQKDMRPKPNKLDGAPNMYERDTPLAFQKMGSRHKSGRTQDENKISHTERFGPSMDTPNRAGRSKKSGVLNGKFDNFYATGPSLWKGPAAITDPPSGIESNTDGSGNYDGRQIRYDLASNRFFGTAGAGAQIGKGDLYEIKNGEFPTDVYQQGDLRADMKEGDSKTNFDQYLSSDIRNLQKSRQDFNKNFQAMNMPGAKFSGKGKKGNNISYVRTPDSPDFDPNLTNKENMMKQMFTAEYYDKDGTLANSAAAMPLSEMNSIARGQIFKDNTAQRNAAFGQSEDLQNFYKKYSKISKK